MNKKIWIIVIIFLLGGIVFYKSGLWYDIGYYLRLPGYNMPRSYCDPGPCDYKDEAIPDQKLESISSIIPSFNWYETGKTSNITISQCGNGKKHNQNLDVYVYGTGRLNSEKNQGVVEKLYSDFTNKIGNLGWTKCTPTTGEGDYFSNIGPNYRETFISPSGKLMQIDRNYSMGIGDELRIQYEE